MSRTWGVALLVLTAASASAGSRSGSTDVVEQVGRSVAAWNREHRGAWSMRFAADRELGGLLYQWEQALPDCRECQLVDVRVTEVAGEAEVRWSLEGDVTARGVTRLSVSGQQLARK
jgi:hypothetical protein